jgi:uncharacterized protein (DUF58 family)
MAGDGMTASAGTARRRWHPAGSGRPDRLPPSAPPAKVAGKAAVLCRLELDVTRRLDGILSGEYLGFIPGPGTEPAGAQAYQPGDDARRIDWSLTARALAPHVRTTEADRELETWIVADRSASLDFGTAQREKREVVLAVVAAFGFLTVKGGNRLGVMVSGGDKLVRFPFTAGRVGMLAALSGLYDTPRATRAPDARADLAAALARIERTQSRRGQVVVVSDFLDASDWAGPLQRLAYRHQVIAVQVVDPREFELPAVGMLSVVDAESGRQLHVQTNSAKLRQRYAAAAAERHQRIARSIVLAGAEHMVASTDRDWLVDVAAFMRRRRGVRRPPTPVNAATGHLRRPSAAAAPPRPPGPPSSMGHLRPSPAPAAGYDRGTAPVAAGSP